MRALCLLWCLWEAGPRISELLALRIRDVRFRDDDTPDLVLPAEVDNLKTGPRTIFVAQCVNPIKVWLSIHPSRSDPDAYLLPNRDGKGAWVPLQVSKLLRRLCRMANVRAVKCHDFRHTAATMKAESGWAESQLCPYFGWSITSDMPRYYVHAARVGIEDRVRRDAGLNDVNQAQKREAGAAVEALLREVLEKMTRERA
jgi:integrase